MTRDLGRLSGTLEKVTVFALILAKLECPENSLVSKLGYLGHEKPFSYVTGCDTRHSGVVQGPKPNDRLLTGHL